MFTIEMVDGPLTATEKFLRRPLRQKYNSISIEESTIPRQLNQKHSSQYLHENYPQKVLSSISSKVSIFAKNDPISSRVSLKSHRTRLS